MAVDEESRHRLYQRLEQVLGRAEAGALMEYLPPVGWADVATRRDLDALEDRIGLRFTLVDQRFMHLERRIERIELQLDGVGAQLGGLRAEFRRTMLAVLSMMVVLVAAMVAAVKL